MKVEPVTVTVPAWPRMPPPSAVPVPLPSTVLLTKRELLTVAGTAVAAEIASAPPTLTLAAEAFALLPLKVVSLTVSCSPAAYPSAVYCTPEPELLPEVLPLTVELRMVSEPPMNWTPPPGLLLVVELTVLLTMAESLMLRLSPLLASAEPAMMPAPPKVLSLPPLIVTPEMLLLTPPTMAGSRSNTRLNPPASMIVVPAPAPVRAMLLPLTLPSCSSPLIR